MVGPSPRSWGAIMPDPICPDGKSWHYDGERDPFDRECHSYTHDAVCDATGERKMLPISPYRHIDADHFAMLVEAGFPSPSDWPLWCLIDGTPFISNFDDWQIEAIHAAVLLNRSHNSGIAGNHQGA